MQRKERRRREGSGNTEMKKCYPRGEMKYR